MGFEFIPWLITFSLNRTGNKTLDWLSKTALSSRLDNEIEDWSKTLPKELDVRPSALFPKTPWNTAQQDRPALTVLEDHLARKVAPTEQVWLEALLEQWNTIRVRPGQRQSFFLLPEQEATIHLRNLALRLALRSVQDEELFRGTVVDELRSDRAQDVPEERVAEGIITFLENKGLLYVALDYEHPHACYKSASAIRDALTELMLRVSRQSDVYRFGDQLRMAFADFMRRLERIRVHEIAFVGDLSDRKRSKFHESIRLLREECSGHIKQLSAAYRIDLSDRLSGIV